MASASTGTVAGNIGRPRIWLGAILLVFGLLGHLGSAYLIRTNPRAYSDHLIGFFGIAVVTGVIIAATGRFFWRGRHDITWIVFGAVQAVMGLVVFAVTTLGVYH